MMSITQVIRKIVDLFHIKSYYYNRIIFIVILSVNVLVCYLYKNILSL